MKKCIVFLLSLISFNCFSQSWTQIGFFSGAIRNNAMAFSVNGKGYVGFGQNGNSYFNDLWEYNPSNNNWVSKGVTPLSSRKQGVSFSIDSMAFVGLGRNSNNVGLSDFFKYNSNTNVWTAAAPYPGNGEALCFFASANGYGFVGGGISTGSSTSYHRDFWRYNPVLDSWTSLGNIPLGNRAVGTSFSIDSIIYFGTGHDGSTAYNDFWAYNVNSNLWIQLPNLPGLARIVPISFVNQSKAVVGAGSQLSTSNVFSDYYEYNPSTNTWTSIPGFANGKRSRTPTFTIDSVSYIATGSDSLNNSLNDFWKFEYPMTTQLVEGLLDNKRTEFYPNPVENKIFFRFNLLESNRVQIFDLNGKLLIDDVLIGKSKLNLNFKSGIYLLKINNESVQKLVKL